MKKDITELFTYIDDFCKQYDNFIKNHFLSNKGSRKPTRETSLSISEIMTIILLFHQSPSKHFKYFYHSYLNLYHKGFPKMQWTWKTNLWTWKRKFFFANDPLLKLLMDLLKPDFNLVHTRHHSALNGFVHILSTLVAYSFKTKKPTIKWNDLIQNWGLKVLIFEKGMIDFFL